MSKETPVRNHPFPNTRDLVYSIDNFGSKIKGYIHFKAESSIKVSDKFTYNGYTWRIVEVVGDDFKGVLV